MELILVVVNSAGMAENSQNGVSRSLIVIGLLMRRASCRVFHSRTLCDVDQMTAQGLVSRSIR